MPRKKKIDETPVLHSDLIANFEASYEFETTCHLYGNDIKFKHCIPVNDELEIINTVVAYVIGDSGEYTPEYLEWTKNCMLIYKYTDIEIKDPEAAYSFIMESEIMESIRTYASGKQLARIDDSISSKIAYELSSNTKLIQTKLESLEHTISEINTVTAEFDKKVDSENMIKLINIMQNSEFAKALSVKQNE